MAEEQRWQEPGCHRLCANNCGFFGSPTTLDLCSKCYKDHCIKEQHLKDAHIAMETTLRGPKSSLVPPSLVSPSSPSPPEIESSPCAAVTKSAPAKAADSVPRPNRCGACQKRVGLTGFACRCGVTFCGSHRYPEKHGCGFDYKSVGKEAIAKSNPVVKADKLHKI